MANPLGHPDNCTCENCVDWRDAQVGLAILSQMKKLEKGRVKCPGCGKMTPNANFCEQCGIKIPRCSKGHVLLAGANFCSECGEKVGQA